MIVKWLSELVEQGATELHISVGQPPILRSESQIQKLDYKVLEPADTFGAMKSITPERHQKEFQDTGCTEFNFVFGSLGRIRVSVFRIRGNAALELRQISDPEGDAGSQKAKKEP